MKEIIRTACKPTLNALRQGLYNALSVECRDVDRASRVASQLHQWIIDIDDELKRLQREDEKS